MLCFEKQQIYRQCIEQNTKPRECKAELESLYACHEMELKLKYLYSL